MKMKYKNTIYLCTFSCLCRESKLYVVNSQKQHTKAFNVWTCLIWLSNSLFDTLTTSHWGHLYIINHMSPPSYCNIVVVIGDSGPHSRHWCNGHAPTAGCHHQSPCISLRHSRHLISTSFCDQCHR